MFRANFAHFFSPQETIEPSEKNPLLKNEDELGQENSFSGEFSSEYERQDQHLRAALKKAQAAYRLSYTEHECFFQNERRTLARLKSTLFYFSCPLGALFGPQQSCPESDEFKEYQKRVLALNEARRNLAKTQNALNQWMLQPRELPAFDENKALGLTSEIQPSLRKS